MPAYEADLAITDLNEAALASVQVEITGMGVHCFAQACDVSSETSVATLAAATHASVGPLDVLVNNAGIAYLGSFQETPVAWWRRTLDVNVLGIVHCIQAFLPAMRAAGGERRIVNVASIAGKEGNPMAAAYSAAKAAVIAMTKSIGKDVARTGVLVNCIAPAVIETPMLGGMADYHIEYMVERIPLGRMGGAEEVAALACWLSSEECSFSTGATFDISGGRAVF